MTKASLKTTALILFAGMNPCLLMAEDRPYFPNNEGLSEQSWVETTYAHSNRNNEVSATSNGTISNQVASDSSNTYSLRLNQNITESLSASASVATTSLSTSNGDIASGRQIGFGLGYKLGSYSLGYGATRQVQTNTDTISFWDHRASINWENEAKTFLLGGSIGYLQNHPDAGNRFTGHELHATIKNETEVEEFAVTGSVGSSIVIRTSVRNGVRSTTLDEVSFTNLSGSYLKKHGSLSFGVNGSLSSSNSRSQPSSSRIGLEARYETAKAFVVFGLERQTEEELRTAVTFAPKATTNTAKVSFSLDLGSGFYGNATYAHSIGVANGTNGTTSSSRTTKSNNLSLAVTKKF